jgi:hypothetical protein
MSLLISPDQGTVGQTPLLHDNTLGAGYGSEDANGELWDYVIQGKALAKALEPNSYGWGFTAGGILHPEIATEENQVEKPSKRAESFGKQACVFTTPKTTHRSRCRKRTIRHVDPN